MKYSGHEMAALIGLILKHSCEGLYEKILAVLRALIRNSLFCFELLALLVFHEWSAELKDQFSAFLIQGCAKAEKTVWKVEDKPLELFLMLKSAKMMRQKEASGYKVRIIKFLERITQCHQN